MPRGCKKGVSELKLFTLGHMEIVKSGENYVVREVGKLYTNRFYSTFAGCIPTLIEALTIRRIQDKGDGYVPSLEAFLKEYRTSMAEFQKAFETSGMIKDKEKV